MEEITVLQEFYNCITCDVNVECGTLALNFGDFRCHQGHQGFIFIVINYNEVWQKHI